MALSNEQKEALRVALGAKKVSGNVADAIISAIDSGANPVAGVVAALGATSNLSAISGTYALPADPTGAEVDATVQDLATEVEARLDGAEAKIDAVIASLKAAGLMAS